MPVFPADLQTATELYFRAAREARACAGTGHEGEAMGFLHATSLQAPSLRLRAAALRTYTGLIVQLAAPLSPFKPDRSRHGR